MPRQKALTIFDAGLQVPAGAAAGKVLQSDASGNGTWQALPGAGPPIVTTFPSSPADRDEVYYQTAAMAALGLRWRCIYDLANTAWVVVGGSPMYAADDTTFSSASSTFVSTSTPILDLPTQGTYDITIEGWIQVAAVTGATALFSYAPGATAANDVWSASMGNPSLTGVTFTAGTQGTASKTTRLGLATVQLALRPFFRATGASGSVLRRRLWAMPVYLNN